MKQDKERLFRKVLQSAAAQLPAANFTALIMQEIEAAAELEAIRPAALASLVKKAEAVQLAPNFSSLVMDHIERLPAEKIYQPIISKKLGLAIAAFVVTGISILTLLGNGNSPGSADNIPYQQTMIAIHNLPIFYPLLLMSTALLLVADFVIQKKKHSS